MPYAQRDDQGRVVGLFANPQPHLGIAEEVPDGTALYNPGEKKAQVRAEARALFWGLPKEYRAKFGGRFSSAITFLDMGDWEAGIQIIEDQPVPSELEGVKAAILDKLREGLA